jgi:hypothetical protein
VLLSIIDLLTTWGITIVVAIVMQIDQMRLLNIYNSNSSRKPSAMSVRREK